MSGESVLCSTTSTGRCDHRRVMRRHDPRTESADTMNQFDVLSVR